MVRASIAVAVVDITIIIVKIVYFLIRISWAPVGKVNNI
jgi:hypothetical protein